MKTLVGLGLVIVLLAGCSSKKEKLVLPEVNNQFRPVVVWDHTAIDGVQHFDSSLRPLITSDKLYAANRTGIVSAFDLASGKRLWAFDIRREEQIGFWRLLVDRNKENARISGGLSRGFGHILLGTENGEVIALNPETGAINWRTKVPGEVLAAPATGDGMIVVNTGSGLLIALDPVTGAKRWTYEQELPMLTIRGVAEPVIVSGGVVFGSGSGKVGVLISDHGLPAWEEVIATPEGATDLARLVDVDAKPVVVGNTMYALAYNGELVALELTSGRPLWKRDYASFRNMAVAENILYVVDSNGRVYAIDRRNGQEVWAQTALERHFVTAPTVFGDYLVFGDNKGYLHWLDRSTGDLVARHRFDKSGLYTAPVTDGEHLVLQSRNGELVVLRLP
ncbi:outer membrane protein assembly factor BamB [Alkalimonas collagenimarina]|uniref:Outer membrane protein assembly factor BamB n=1 Tax=Alkalimonas collagenimarina TaxID=400390 RepID=A0ABT9H310_9GAMM|nr:outer membrane protein assembly factor BamB [Alkalimonas collagenimarina]MDP4537706.1 outer membrane protein assembly factor BamB [Alkalimonas collagenimarina]